MIVHHLRINGERCPIERPRHRGEAPKFADGSEQCDDCGADADDSFSFSLKIGSFTCSCGAIFPVLEGGFISD